jgi:DNA-binding winged helix-turn-helix (wHTH) protein
VLVRNSQQVVLKDDLMKAVWPDSLVEESDLTQNIFSLRKTLGETVEGKPYIVTIPGRGYRFVEAV